MAVAEARQTVQRATDALRLAEQDHDLARLRQRREEAERRLTEAERQAAKAESVGEVLARARSACATVLAGRLDELRSEYRRAAEQALRRAVAATAAAWQDWLILAGLESRVRSASPTLQQAEALARDAAAELAPGRPTTAA